VLSADFGTVAGSQALFRAFLAERGYDASELSGRFGERTHVSQQGVYAPLQRAVPRLARNIECR
jgi:hypothetical protein